MKNKLPKNVRVEDLKSSATIHVENGREKVRTNEPVNAEEGNGGNCSCNRCSN